MSADEIIEQIKLLPPSELKKLVALIREIDDAHVNRPGVRYMDDATFDAAVERVFAKHEELFRRLAR